MPRFYGYLTEPTDGWEWKTLERTPKPKKVLGTAVVVKPEALITVTPGNTFNNPQASAPVQSAFKILKFEDKTSSYHTENNENSSTGVKSAFQVLRADEERSSHSSKIDETPTFAVKSAFQILRVVDKVAHRTIYYEDGKPDAIQCHRYFNSNMHK